MSNISFSENICLSSVENEAEPSVERTTEQITNSRFEQKGRFGSYQARLRIFNDHYLAVETAGLFGRGASYELDCTFLDPRPLRVVRIDWWSAGVTLAIACCLAAVAWRAPQLAAPGKSVWISAGLLLSAAVLALGMCLYRSTDRILFCSRHGRAPLVKLLNRKPTAAQLQAFVDDLARRIEQAQQGRDGDVAEYLRAELKEHRRLKDDGALSEAAYEVIKARLLRAHGAA